MTERPTLLTPRLCLRPFRPMDGPEVRRQAGDFEVARHVGAAVPHPYPEGAAETWIATHADRFSQGLEVALAITRLSDHQLMGSMGLYVAKEESTAELGYWVGQEFWGEGYATEAGAALIAYGFETLGLFRIFARAHTDNPGSCRVLLKLGMRPEGVMRGHSVRLGVRHDMAFFGLLATEWQERHRRT